MELEELVASECIGFTRSDSDTDVTRRSYTLVYQPTSIGFTHNETFSQLRSENAGYLNSPKVHYESVLEGREDINTIVNPEPSSAVSTTTPHGAEHLDLVGPGVQDSDEVDGDLSSLDSSLRSIGGLLATVNEECQSVGEVTCDSVEATHQEDDDDEKLIVTGSPVQCQEKNNEISQHAVYVIPQKTTQAVEEFIPLKPKEQHHYATVCYVSTQWEGEFPYGEAVTIRHNTDHYFQNALTTNGHVVTLKITAVSLILDKKLFEQWHQLDNSNQLDSIVAYLEDQDCGYLVREHIDHNLAEAVNKIIRQWDVVTAEFTELDNLPQHSASCMKNWEKKFSEKRKLSHCFGSLIGSTIEAMEELHKLKHVSLNVRVSNFFVRTTCDCWATAACVHDGYGMNVVIGGCDLAHHVGSIVTGNPDSKAFQLVDPLHQYKRAEVVYDKLDLVFTIIKVLTKFSGQRKCKEMLKQWMSSIVGSAQSTESLVAQIRQLFNKCEVNDGSVVQKLADYLEMSAVHYAELLWEHEV